EITAEAEPGKTYLGKVTRIANFGAFVEILPGLEGLLHISEVAEHRVKEVQDEIKEGEEILVKVIEVDGDRVRLSRKAVLRDKAFFGERLGNSLIKLGFIEEDTLGDYLAEQSRTRYAPARRLERVPPEVIAAVPARIAAKYCIVPIAIESRRIHLAMRDPKDL